jgi:hypothetical protein
MKPINFCKIQGRIAAICLLFLLSSMPGCLQDDLSVCGMRIMFRYTENGSQDNRFATDVGQVSVYVFDATTGLFLQEHSATVDQLVDSCVMSINIYPGNYHFIAWGNVTSDYEITPFVKGQTSLDEALLTLKAQENLVSDYPDELFYGATMDYEVVPALQQNLLIPIDMMNNNKRIHVIAHGLYDDNSIQQADPDNPIFHCLITSKNGNYRFDNNPTGEQYTYIPQERLSVADEVLLSDFVVLRELNAPAATSSRLRVLHRDVTPMQSGGEAVEEEFLDLPLTELLIAATLPNGGGSLDNYDDVTIEVFVTHTNGTVTVRVNDWMYVGGGGGVLGKKMD